MNRSEFPSANALKFLFAGDFMSVCRNGHANGIAVRMQRGSAFLTQGRPLRLRQPTGDYAKAWRAHTVHASGRQIRGCLESSERRRAPDPLIERITRHVTDRCGQQRIGDAEQDGHAGDGANQPFVIAERAEQFARVNLIIALHRGPGWRPWERSTHDMGGNRR